MPTLLPDDEISEIMSFDIKQHALFNVVLEWSKKYVIFILTPLQYSTHSLFLIGCRGTITRDIYHAVSKTILSVQRNLKFFY